MRLEVRFRLAMRVEQRRAAALRCQGASQRMRATEEMGEQRMRAMEERTEEMGRQRVVRRMKERALKERLLMRLLERRGQSEEMTLRVQVRSRRLPLQRWR